MKWIRKGIRIVLFTLGIVVIAFLIFLHQFRISIDYKKLVKNFKAQNLTVPQYKQFDLEKASFNYLDTETEDKPLALLFHGSPGSARDFLSLFKDTVITANFRLIGIERPGYGEAQYGKGVANIAVQAQLFASFIEKLKQHTNQPVYLIAHSYGGAIAANTTAFKPHLVDGLILAATAIDPEKEKYFWVNTWLKFKPLHAIMPSWLKQAQAEKMLHAEQLKVLENELQKITCPVYALHGTNDWVVPIENLSFIEKKCMNAEKIIIKKIADQNHFFPIKGMNYVMEALNDLAGYN